MPCPEPVVKIEEEDERQPNEVQVIELEVEKPRHVLSYGISYIFVYSSFSS